MVRLKNRYMVVEVNEVGKLETSSLKLREPSLFASILEQVQQMHGDFGIASIRAGFIAKYLNEHTRVAVIRSRRGPHKFVSSIIPLIRKIEDKHVVVNILYIGASIKQCLSFLKTYQQKKFDEYCASLKTEEERKQLEEVMLNFDHIMASL